MMVHERWEAAERGDVHNKVVSYVAEVEQNQASIYDRFAKLECLYDPNSFRPEAEYYGVMNAEPRAEVEENLVASNVDTVTAVIAATEVRARFMTDDGNWSTQRRAKRLETYSNGIAKLLRVHETAEVAFKECAIKGTGLIKVYIDDGEIVVERTMPDDVIVDEEECQAGEPRQLHHRMLVDRDKLKARFPKFEAEIDNAMDSWKGRYWAGYRNIRSNEVVALESWHLPIGKMGSKNHVPGRHTLVIPGADLLDEEYHESYFPFAKMVWSRRVCGWYGIGLAERIAGHQRRVNRMNWQVDRQLDQLAVPTTYIRPADAGIAIKTTNRAGTFMVYKADMPKTVIPPAVSGETYARMERVSAKAYEESGVSRLAASSMKPAGLESGAALREYRDQTTQRFAMQEKAYERFLLDTIWLVLGCCKKLGKDAPTVFRQSRYGPQRIDWGKVDMGETRVQIAASNPLAKTPAGRKALVLEFAQAGVVTLDEARRLIEHPDTESALSMYTAALEDIERCIEDALDSELVVPEPYQNLKMGVWRFQQAYLKARNEGAPEEVLENLRQWIVQAIAIQNMGQPPAPAMPGGPEAITPGAPEGMPPDMPMGPAPMSAFAPESIGVAPA